MTDFEVSQEFVNEQLSREPKWVQTTVNFGSRVASLLIGGSAVGAIVVAAISGSIKMLKWAFS